MDKIKLIRTQRKMNLIEGSVHIYLDICIKKSEYKNSYKNIEFLK